MVDDEEENQAAVEIERYSRLYLPNNLAGLITIGLRDDRR